MDFAAARATMIESQVRTNDVSDLTLQTAMATVPREDFVVPAKRAFAYAELTCETPSGRPLWKPRDFAKLAQAAKILSGDRVLVIAGGAGYSGAVLAAMGCKVTIFDTAFEGEGSWPTDIARTTGDLTKPPPGPYDIVFVDGGVETIPAAWTEILADGGRLCVVVETIAARVVFDAIVPRLSELDAVRSFAF